MLGYNFVVRVCNYQGYKVKYTFATITSQTYIPSFLKDVAFLTSLILAISIWQFPGGFKRG